MTLARKPPTKPLPTLTRPLAQPKENRNPITTEIMQRVRRAIRDRALTATQAADEIGVSRSQFADWISHKGGAPYGDNLVLIQRWLARSENDQTFIPDILTSPRIRFRGTVDSIRAVKLSERKVESIRREPDGPGILERLGRKHHVHPTMIQKIRSGERR